jgi:putative tryptophan/tyrosine transport system substrate-binding protein
MRRRDFIKIIPGLAAAYPLLARAEQSKRRIGVVIARLENDPVAQAEIAALFDNLRQLGWTAGAGGNIQVDYRFPGSDIERIRADVAELVGLQPDVIIAHSTPVNVALQRVNRTIPAVFLLITDPIGSGLVESLAHPGGNITGFSNYDFELGIGGKWVQTLKEIDPRVERVASVFNPQTAPYAGAIVGSIEAAQKLFTVTTPPMPVHDGAELERAIADFASTPNGGLIVLPDSFNINNRKSIISLAAKYRVPAIYPFKLFVSSGGLVSYGSDDIDIFRRAASYVDLILKGRKPSDLPAQTPTKYELAINLKTAKALGLTVPLVDWLGFGGAFTSEPCARSDRDGYRSAPSEPGAAWELFTSRPETNKCSSYLVSVSQWKGALHLFLPCSLQGYRLRCLCAGRIAAWPQRAGAS